MLYVSISNIWIIILSYFVIDYLFLSFDCH